MTLDNLVRAVSSGQCVFDVGSSSFGFSVEQFNNYMNSANNILKKVDNSLILKEASFFDSKGVYELQKNFKNLAFSQDAIDIIISYKDAFNLIIKKKNADEVICACLGYPSNYWENMIHDVGDADYMSVTHLPELNDSKSFFIEMKATRSDYQGMGLYRIIRSVVELAVNDLGYDKIHILSVDDAYNIHKKEGFNLISHLSKLWNDVGIEPIDGYFMNLDLTKERIDKDRDLLHL